MASFEWQEKYSCNNSMIDEQHKKLFSLAEMLYCLFKNNETTYSIVQIENIIKELYDYTEYHFKFEESLVLKNKYDMGEYVRHKSEHGSFLLKIKSINIDEFKANPKKSVADLSLFVISWIKSHILEEDKKILKYFDWM